MATTTTPVMTWEAFERLPDSDGMHRELLEGALQVLPPPKFGHEKIAKRLYQELLALESRGLGTAFHELGFKLSHDPATWIRPDASFLFPGRVESVPDEDFVKGAPEVAAEIVSPSESASDIADKVALLLGAGSQAVWVVYPKKHTVHVYTPDRRSVILGIGDSLTAPFLLEGWSVPVARLFED